MPGTQASGRPGGNPDLKKYSFKTDRTESCTASMNVRVPPSMLAELKSKENWQELVRLAIAKELAKAS